MATNEWNDNVYKIIVVCLKIPVVKKGKFWYETFGLQIEACRPYQTQKIH